MTKITVYRYELSDRQTGQAILAARLATVAAIRRVKGSAILESQCFVEPSQVDGDGFVHETTAVQPR